MESSPTKNPYLESNDVIQINTNPYLPEEEKEESPKDEEEYKSLDSHENSANEQLHSTSQEVIDVGDELAELDG
jgi:predicted  nucleic acid-binding Zn-ribbon protein